jgi:hypothetical protein
MFLITQVKAKAVGFWFVPAQSVDNTHFSTVDAGALLSEDGRPFHPQPYTWGSGNGSAAYGKREHPSANYSNIVVFSYGQRAGSTSWNGACEWNPDHACRDNPLGYVLDFPMKTNELLKDAAGGNVREKVQKPFDLCRELLRMYTAPGDIVLEMCCGTAPFAMAGLLEGRHVLSLDVDATVVDLASARLEEASVVLHWILGTETPHA